MKRRLLSLICLIMIIGLITGCGTQKQEEQKETNSKQEEKQESTERVSVRDFTTSQTFYFNAPTGYILIDDGTINSEPEFGKKTKNGSITIEYEFEKDDDYFEKIEENYYTERISENYYYNVEKEDKKIINLGEKEVEYLVITYNSDTSYYKEIYTRFKIDDWPLSCKIEEVNNENAEFSNTKDLIHTALSMEFSEEK